MKNKTIMIVDDIAINLDILVDILQDYSVVSVTNGQDSIEIAISQKIDLILLDIVMPDMNGYEVCAKLKSMEKTKHIPVIFITAKDAVSSIGEAYKVGGIDYIQKPFEPVEALSRIKTQLDLQMLIANLEQSEKELHVLNHSLEEKVKEEIEKNKKQEIIMMQQSRHAQMGEIISMIAHQWKQPLNNLSMIVSDITIKNELNKLDKQTVTSLSSLAKKQITQMTDTIEDFRNFFKPNNKRVEFNVLDAINQVMNVSTSILKYERINLEMDLEDDVVMDGFVNELGHVLLNIISNAKDALLEKNIENKKINLSLKSVGDNAEIIIKDNAGGVPKEIIDKIFDSYFSTKSEQNGTGLGLYMSKIIISEHFHGEIEVFNDEDGAVFKLVLPKRYP